MKLPRVRFVTVVAVLLWSSVIVLGAWLAAYQHRKDFADYSPSEQIDQFTPTRLVHHLLLDGGTQIFEATAVDGSYVVRMRHDATTPVLVELCTAPAGTALDPTAPETAALQRSLERALASGQLSADSDGVARALQKLLARGVAAR
jgi:hypothetical protein